MAKRSVSDFKIATHISNHIKMEKPTILITGAQGQLGNEFRFLAFTHPNFRFIYTDVADLDITKPKAVMNFFAKNTPQYVINCAAYTAVDQAEKEPELAAAINTAAPAALAEAAARASIPFLHVSTDYVFDGTKLTPYTETDRVNPLSVYGRTKEAGEAAIRAAGPLAFCELVHFPKPECAARGYLVNSGRLAAAACQHFI